VAGLQEYIEAVTFHEYLMNSSLQSWTKIQADMSYTNVNISAEDDSQSTTVTEESAEDSRPTGDHDAALKTLVSPVDYILGVADLTGELMRKCINNLGSGDIEGCYQTCTFVKEIYSGFLSVSYTGIKDMARKLITLRQSLSKMENACYTIHVRGSEIPKHMLADVISATQDDFLEEDEGFY
jgi:predicted translin family RNA/ssDNA-binding protein